MQGHMGQCRLKQIAGWTVSWHGIKKAKQSTNRMYSVHKGVSGHGRTDFHGRLLSIQEEVDCPTITICKLSVHRYLCWLRLSYIRLTQGAKLRLSTVKVFFRHRNTLPRKERLDALAACSNVAFAGYYAELCRGFTASQRSAKFATAACNLDFTVPSGIPSISLICRYGN